MDYTYQDVAKMIDHSLLNPTLTVAELDKGIQIALDYDVASVCIMPYALKHCAEQLQGSAVKASTTIGFPHGGHTTAIKVAEACRHWPTAGKNSTWWSISAGCSAGSGMRSRRTSAR
jgi:deoxyribose-phosphate aldolase